MLCKAVSPGKRYVSSFSVSFSSSLPFLLLLRSPARFLSLRVPLQFPPDNFWFDTDKFVVLPPIPFWFTPTPFVLSRCLLFYPDAFSFDPDMTRMTTSS